MLYMFRCLGSNTRLGFESKTLLRKLYKLCALTCIFEDECLASSVVKDHTGLKNNRLTGVIVNFDLLEKKEKGTCV